MAVRLVHYKAASGNVGDDFSEWLFSRYLGERLAPDGDVLLFGVGSILDRNFEKAFGEGARRHIVFGSGARGARRVPDMSGGDWTVYCVRGPLTARALGLSCDKAVADPAILAPLWLPAAAQGGARGAAPGSGPVGIVPYFGASAGLWERIAQKLGWKVVSPHLGVEPFVEALTQCSRLFCESMHGAIFADAYGIPWRPVSATGAVSEGPTHAFKWTDWTASMGIGFDSIKTIGLSRHQPGGPLGALRQRAKAEIVARALSRADEADRFLLSDRRVLASQQDRLQELMNRMLADLGAEG